MIAVRKITAAQNKLPPASKKIVEPTRPTHKGTNKVEIDMMYLLG
jgi:hypothetical protein